MYKWPLWCCSPLQCFQRDNSLLMWVASISWRCYGSFMEDSTRWCSCPGSKEEIRCSCCASYVSAYTHSSRACPCSNRWSLLNCVSLWGAVISKSSVVTRRCCSHWCVVHYSWVSEVSSAVHWVASQFFRLYFSFTKVTFFFFFFNLTCKILVFLFPAAIYLYEWEWGIHCSNFLMLKHEW